MAVSFRQPARPGWVLIFRAWVTRNGKRDYARDHGHKAWPIWVRR